MHQGQVFVGTSGWNFKSWEGDFYPDRMPGKELLPEYARHFRSVEVNNSFYNLPEPETAEAWAKDVPNDFRFACKASRYITHMKKLKDPAEGIDRLMEALEPLGKKLGPILFQLPPNWRVNTERLEAFLEKLPGRHRYTFEFRDPSWHCDEVYELLEEYKAALCFYDYQKYQSPERPTADFVYIRLHGPEETAYTGSYDGRTLAGYARKIQRWQEEGRDVYCYFDNDEKACAPKDAAKLCEMLAGR
ncbi:DUF72 domain-containing protein [Marinobacter salicampi]|uniref:DUF72 domain-containing protein n=1 Tax=Marinobacter salicampi TaxID=435907 RepID=UPI00140C7451|nr:DUF72 domain-containing protein [Marinobacter salicampi]